MTNCSLPSQGPPTLADQVPLPGVTKSINQRTGSSSPDASRCPSYSETVEPAHEVPMRSQVVLPAS